MKFKDFAPDYATKNFAFELKALTEDGSIEGYGSVFNNVDSYGEKVMPGAFQESLAKHEKDGTSPLMLWQHNPASPIGVWKSIAEDKRGLKVKGQFIKGVRQSDEAYMLIKGGALQGLSIGYREIEADIVDGVRLLKQLDLMEISAVSFAANPKARVTDIKSEKMWAAFAKRLRDGTPPSVKEFEELLRDAGFPKSLTTQIASVGYAKAIRSDSEGKAITDTLGQIRKAVEAFNPRKGT